MACGTPTLAAQDQTEQSPRREPSGHRRSIIIAIVVVVLAGALASAAWFLLGSNRDSVSESAPEEVVASRSGDAVEDSPAAIDTTTTLPTTTTTTATPSEVDCSQFATTAANAAADLSVAFGGRSIQDISRSARSATTLLPGAAAFQQIWQSATAAADDEECDRTTTQDLYFEALAALRAPADSVSSLAYRALTETTFGDDEPLLMLSAALRAYPQHGPVVRSPAAITSMEQPRWVVMLASMGTDEYSRQDADVRVSEFTRGGIPAEVLLSDLYASLTPGYWAVYAGPFDERESANSYCISIQSDVPDCYQRYVQAFPSTDPPFGTCGPYGRIDVTGVASDRTLPVLSRPETGRTEIGVLASNATDVLIAGPEIVSDETWTPIAFGTEIGWVQTRFVSNSSTCPRTTPGPSTISCVDIAERTLGIFGEITRRGTAYEDAGDLSAPSGGELDGEIADLIREASAGSCTAVELNALVAIGRRQIATDGQLASLILDVLYAEDFFATG